MRQSAARVENRTRRRWSESCNAGRGSCTRGRAEEDAGRETERGLRLRPLRARARTTPASGWVSVAEPAPRHALIVPQHEYALDPRADYPMPCPGYGATGAIKHGERRRCHCGLAMRASGNALILWKAGVPEHAKASDRCWDGPQARSTQCTPNASDERPRRKRCRLKAPRESGCGPEHHQGARSERRQRTSSRERRPQQARSRRRRRYGGNASPGGEARVREVPKPHARAGSNSGRLRRKPVKPLM